MTIYTKLDKNILGANLKTIRLNNNDTQDAIANIIKTDQSNYSKYELGKNLTLTYLIIEFARHYSVLIDWICVKTKDSDIK